MAFKFNIFHEFVSIIWLCVLKPIFAMSQIGSHRNFVWLTKLIFQDHITFYRLDTCTFSCSVSYCSTDSTELSQQLTTFERFASLSDLASCCAISKYHAACFLAHLSRRLEWAIVIAHRPSSVRPSSVVRPSVRPSVRKLFTFSTSSPEPLDGFWWNLVGMKYSWSLTSVVVFRPDPPRGGSRAGPK